MLLIIYINRFYFIIITVAILMSLSRIFMSMHFPSDLFAGAYLGSIVPVLFYDKACPGSKAYFKFTDEFLDQDKPVESAA